MDVMILLNAIETWAIRDNMLVDLMIKNDCPDKKALQEALGQVEVITARLRDLYKKEHKEEVEK